MTNLIDKYYSKAETSEDASMVLTLFVCELYEIQPSISIKKLMNRHTRLYGWKRVFIAIVHIGTYYGQYSESRNATSAEKRLGTLLERQLKWEFADELRKRGASKENNLTSLIKQEKINLSAKSRDFNFKDFD